MTDHYSMFLIAWMFIILIGAWVLVNALIDLGARRIRRWFSEHWGEQHSAMERSSIRQRISR